MMRALALAAVASLALGCRGRARASEKARGESAGGAAAPATTAEPWSCGAVHDATAVKRTFGTRARVKIGAIADTQAASAATVAAVETFAARFAEAHVDLVAALGDLGGDADEDAKILAALGGAKAPIVAIAGERESENSFHEAVKRARNSGLDVIDLVEKRVIAGDNIDIVSLPGYPITDSGCRYRAADLARVATLVDGKRPVVILGHMPPRGEGAGAVDATWGKNNVGDRDVARVVAQLAPVAALFAHVDEAGGHVAKAARGIVANVGSADAVGGARAAIVTIADGNASFESLQ
jgi:Icc-related predicted phosphoesterase